MRLIFLLVLMTLQGSLHAGISDKVDSRWAYYGEDFYRALNSRSVDRQMISLILNAKHQDTQTFDKVGECSSNCYVHTPVGYSNARTILFGELYVLTNGQGMYVNDVYCNKEIHYRQVSDISHMSDEVNIEHTWPQSKFNKSFPKEMQKSDLHHLFPADSKANSQRGNNEFGKSDGKTDELNVHDCAISKLVRGNSGRIFEPPKAHRGNVARALFYFAFHYNMPISKDQEAALREWHKADPADAMEIKRHEMIAKKQNSRNPFVDHPELVDMIKDF
jgi:endonuclease I